MAGPKDALLPHPLGEIPPSLWDVQLLLETQLRDAKAPWESLVAGPLASWPMGAAPQQAGPPERSVAQRWEAWARAAPRRAAYQWECQRQEQPASLASAPALPGVPLDARLPAEEAAQPDDLPPVQPRAELRV